MFLIIIDDVAYLSAIYGSKPILFPVQLRQELLSPKLVPSFHTEEKMRSCPFSFVPTSYMVWNWIVITPLPASVRSELKGTRTSLSIYTIIQSNLVTVFSSTIAIKWFLNW